MKDRIRENGIDYILVGDYYIPDLELSEEERRIGKCGCMHREYLKENNQWEWIQKMNSIHNCAEEIVLNEMIYR